MTVVNHFLNALPRGGKIDHRGIHDKIRIPCKVFIENGAFPRSVSSPGKDNASVSFSFPRSKENVEHPADPRTRALMKIPYGLLIMRIISTIPEHQFYIVAGKNVPEPLQILIDENRCQNFRFLFFLLLHTFPHSTVRFVRFVRSRPFLSGFRPRRLLFRMLPSDSVRFVRHPLFQRKLHFPDGIVQLFSDDSFHIPAVPFFRQQGTQIPDPLKKTL